MGVKTCHSPTASWRLWDYLYLLLLCFGDWCTELHIQFISPLLSLSLSVCICFSDIMCGMLHCTPADDQSARFSTYLRYSRWMSTYTIGSVRYNCDSVIIDVGLQRQDPGLAPTGAKCGDGQVVFASPAILDASETTITKMHDLCRNCSSKPLMQPFLGPTCSSF